MKEYAKIQSVFKRDEKTHKFILGEFSLPEFKYLKDNIWVFTEKVDGTNVRVMWDGSEVRFGGKTNDAQMPTFLLLKLQELFLPGKFKELPPLCLYGEGYGARIQKGGGNYIPNGCDFILIDILIDNWWLERENIEDIASKLCIKVVPIIGSGSIDAAIAKTSIGFNSTFGNFSAEGIVLKPQVALTNRKGERVITKVKHKDF